MLAIKPNCESCGKDLPPRSTEAVICSFECTFCERCADSLLHNICPNCGGGFEKRPVRPQDALKRHPASTDSPSVGINQDSHLEFIRRFPGVPPNRR